jgi:hypothetical protein
MRSRGKYSWGRYYSSHVFITTWGGVGMTPCCQPVLPISGDFFPILNPSQCRCNVNSVHKIYFAKIFPKEPTNNIKYERDFFTTTNSHLKTWIRIRNFHCRQLYGGHTI